MASPLQLRDNLQSQSRATRELLIFVGSLGLGLFVIPPLIWLAGTLTLDPYANGGIGALFTDFFQGLASVTPSFWVVALGPYVLILAARGLFSFFFPRKTAQATPARPEAQRGQDTQRRQTGRTGDTQPREQVARRPAPVQRAEPLLGEELPPEAEEESEEPEPIPEPPRRMAPQARQAPPQPPRPTTPQPRQAPQMREPPAVPPEASLPQMRATPAAPREVPPQMRQPPTQPRAVAPQVRQAPVQPREAPGGSMWPATPAQQREAPSQPRQAPPQARETAPQRRESPRAPVPPPAPTRAGTENPPAASDVKSTNKPGKKRIPPTIGDL